MRLWSFLVAGLIGLGAVTALVTPASADGQACGSKENPCPLQKWMQANVGSKMADGDMKGVATGLDKAATLSPDASWSDWPTFAKAGADAARKNDTAGVKAACKNCHDKFKQQYKDKYRSRALP